MCFIFVNVGMVSDGGFLIGCGGIDMKWCFCELIGVGI